MVRLLAFIMVARLTTARGAQGVPIVNNSVMGADVQRSHQIR